MSKATIAAAEIVKWWASNKSTSLDVLAAKIAASWADSTGYVRCSIIDDGINPPTLSIDLEDKTGLVTTTWQPSDQVKALEDVVVPQMCATIRRKREILANPTIDITVGKG